MFLLRIKHFIFDIKNTVAHKEHAFSVQIYRCSVKIDLLRALPAVCRANLSLLRAKPVAPYVAIV